MPESAKIASSTHSLVSIVILSYNSADYLPACLASVARTTYRPIEIVVADNASGDTSVAVARQIAENYPLPFAIESLPQNLGCAGGNNVGWRKSRGDIIIFLNPDTEVEPEFVSRIVTPMSEDPSIGITGAKIYYPDSRTLQHAGAILYPNAMTDHHGVGQQDTGKFDERREVDYVTGAAMAVRREILEQVGGFDEDFFPAYYEETDLTALAKRLGWRVLYVPDAVVYHHESVSLTANSKSFHRLYQRMRIRYCLKHYSLYDWVRRFVPFEIWWMRFEPRARGHRLEQFRAYAEGAAWLLKKKLSFQRVRRKLPRKGPVTGGPRAI